MSDFRYNEDKGIQELTEYVNGTLGQHYSTGKIQAGEVIIDAGHGEGYCIGAILKYILRYGKKEGKNRKDLMKLLHYGLILLYLNDNGQGTSTSNLGNGTPESMIAQVAAAIGKMTEKSKTPDEKLRLLLESKKPVAKIEVVPVASLEEAIRQITPEPANMGEVKFTNDNSIPAAPSLIEGAEEDMDSSR